MEDFVEVESTAVSKRSASRSSLYLSIKRKSFSSKDVQFWFNRDWSRRYQQDMWICTRYDNYQDEKNISNACIILNDVCACVCAVAQCNTSVSYVAFEFVDICGHCDITASLCQHHYRCLQSSSWLLKFSHERKSGLFAGSVSQGNIRATLLSTVYVNLIQKLNVNKENVFFPLFLSISIPYNVWIKANNSIAIATKSFDISIPYPFLFFEKRSSTSDSILESISSPSPQFKQRTIGISEIT